MSGSARADFEVAACGRTHARSTQYDGEDAVSFEGSCLVLSDGRLPLVRDVEDPLLLGVHRAALRGGEAALGLVGSVPEYVPRDLDDGLRARLAVGSFVLLVGDSTAGKSRAAFEAARATVADHVLICPVPGPRTRAS